MTQNAADPDARQAGDSSKETECPPGVTSSETLSRPPLAEAAVGEPLGPVEPSAGEAAGEPVSSEEPSAGKAAGEPLGPVEPSAGKAAGEPVGSAEPSAEDEAKAQLAGPEQQEVGVPGTTGFAGPQEPAPAAGLAEPFRSFFAHYGPTLCGRPLGEVVIEEGRRRQYFECLALEEHEPGRLRLVRLGEAWMAIRQGQRAVRAERSHAIVDVSRSLRRDPAQHYNLRPLCDIRYLVLHHTGASAAFGPEAIATAHVEENGWPGIGYHFVIDLAGTIYRTQDLTVVSYHARQFNPASVGIALMGDLTSAQPTPGQLEATADLIAGLLFDLGLPLDAVRGHREMVPTPCPGDPFLRVWRPRLMTAIQERIDARQAERVSQMVGGSKCEP